MTNPVSLVARPNGELEISRRSLVGAGLGAAALTALPAGPLFAAAKTATASETLTATLFNSLTAEQRKAVCFGFDDPLRLKVDNYWFITPTRVHAFSGDQQEMIRQIFMGLHNPAYAEMVMQQIVDDNHDFGNTSIAFFGEPGTGKFEFVQTGGHLTRRCDGDSIKGAAFGGPIFYGHGKMGPGSDKADHSGNVYWYQAKQANRVFEMMDGRQRALALLDTEPGEHGTDTVKLSGKTTGLPGIPMTELSHDQKAEVRRTLATLLAPFRASDVHEALKLVEAKGFDHLHMAFYKGGDVADDKAWNIWRIEGPAMLWYFRGVPHVHTWVNIRRSADA